MSSAQNDQELLMQLAAHRQRIDEIDLQLLELMNQRAQCALEIGKIKAQNDAPVMRPEREAQVIDRLLKHNRGPLHNQKVCFVFKEIMSCCRALEKQIQVAFLGPLGTFSEQAVWAFFGHSVDVSPVESIEQACHVVQVDQSDYAVVPVENSNEGSVARTLDELVESNLLICGEVLLPIHHQLLCQSGKLDGIAKICAHPQALAQCRNWLRQHAPHIAQEAVSSNAAAALLASQDDTVAAIAGQAAKERYSLQAYQEHIQDDVNNTTRFWVLGKQRTYSTGNDKTSLVVSVPNAPGAVYRLLGPFNQENVSLTRFESRPVKNKLWEYNFFIDLQGHETDEPVKKALEELTKNATYIKVLGSYPAMPEVI